MSKLPENSIGISDILDYRECPQRHAHGMRRHYPLPERLALRPGEKDDPPGHTNWTNAYGSAVHEAIHLVETGLSHKAAVAEALKEYGTYLDPEHIPMLYEDLALYERRRPLGVTLVATEVDRRVPLFVHNGEQIYFRFKLDVLQRLIANPSVFLHRDYKSSAHRKTPKEVHNDKQLWAYNWAIHELYPECQTLLQTYDQLRFGEVPTSKNDEQREQMGQWLVEQVRLILEDDTYVPKQNDFCRWCPLVVTCRETRRATDYWRGTLAVLAPLTKEGRKVKVEFAEEGDELERIIRDVLPKMMQTRKHLAHVETELKAIIEAMPVEERERLGWRVKERRVKSISPDGLRELHGSVGDMFYQLVSLSMSRLEEVYGKPKKGEEPAPELKIARSWQTEEVGGGTIVPANSGE